MTDRAPGEVETVARQRAISAVAKVRNDANDCACDGCLVDAVLNAVRGQSRDDTVKHVAGALNAAIENASTREHFVRRIKMLLDELDVGADQAEARDDTVALVGALQRIDDHAKAGDVSRFWLIGFLEPILARFGADRADRTNP